MVETATSRLQFNYKLSNQRCQAPKIGFTWRTVDAVRVRTAMELVLLAYEDPRVSRHTSLTLKSMVKTVAARATDMQSIVEQFVFVIPVALSKGPQLITSKPDLTAMATRRRVCQDIAPLFTAATLPLYPSMIRQKIFFPDRKLVQFDSGKLQTLCVLLRDLKRDGHKCLIFTQMSKMLDILEVFLNLHAHTYVRLDGSTGIDMRQKLMDRFNSDPKLFCFILSTRSGGLGINLTGADTVIFYDSDWNPAMDAQAQDRAHRIGQTREVHIYRLVCSSTVEENILQKAKQKKHLDFLVMTEGDFSEDSLFSAAGLKDVLGLPGEGALAATSSLVGGGGGGGGGAAGAVKVGGKVDVEAAMAAAEDEEDVSAMRVAHKEAEQDAAEFDENAPSQVDAEGDDGDEEKDKENGAARAAAISASTSLSTEALKEAEEKDLEAEFASWQQKVRPLNPVPRLLLAKYTGAK